MSASTSEATWDELVAVGDAFTCYSAALAAWTAQATPTWRPLVNGGLWLALVEAQDGLFGFSHFEPALAASLGLTRRFADGEDEALHGIQAELGARGRVLVAGDGFNLPWHVACGRSHVPHWFVLVAEGAELAVVDPFSCRTELGLQQPTRVRVAQAELPSLIPALPPDDPVLVLRDSFALGSDDRPLRPHGYAWLVAEEPPGPVAPSGPRGPDAVERLAAHFRARATDPGAYVQADDLWSVGRHRAYLARVAAADAAAQADRELAAWSEAHALPLASRWGHVAPLLMQARLALTAGRTPTSSLPDALSELAAREAAAAEAFPVAESRGRRSPSDLGR